MAICCYESAASKLISISTSPPTNLSKPNTCFFSVSQTLRLRCNLSLPSKTLVTEPQPLFTSVKSFAPATVANLGPGFDFLGCAVDGIGDFVTLRLDPQVHPGEISISDINGNSSTKLSKNPLWNCAGIAAIAVMKMLNIRSVGLSLSLHKGLPLGSGLGSSAASAAAAAVAVNEMFGGPLSVSDLVLAGLESESKVSGYHADNVAPAIMGGFVLIRSYDPLELIRLNFPNEKDLFFVLVSPEFEAPTKKMRAALPTEITMSHHVWNCSQAGALVASVLQGAKRERERGEKRKRGGGGREQARERERGGRSVMAVMAVGDVPFPVDLDLMKMMMMLKMMKTMMMFKKIWIVDEGKKKIVN